MSYFIMANNFKLRSVPISSYRGLDGTNGQWREVDRIIHLSAPFVLKVDSLPHSKMLSTRVSILTFDL